MERGAVVGLRFEVEGLARAGGMGSVFRARDRESGEWVALKIAHPEAMQHADRFAREATVLAELRHPGIVKYVAHGRTDAGEMFLAMEWLEGEDLQQRLARSGLALDESVALIARVADTLSAAHKRGLVHRDLKPSNLFLPAGDVARAKVLDFGIVRVSNDHDRSTQTGMVLGTIGYMAPEQARGSHDLDARADVFALGCVLFECLTARPAFTGRDALAVQAKILLEDAPRVDELRTDVPGALCDLVARMLAKEPGRRPADAEAVNRELAAISRGEVQKRRSERPPGLTTGEQRLLCVVMLSPTRPQPLNDSAAPTLASDSHGGSVFAMREAARVYGGRLEALANGSVIVTLDSVRTERLLEGTHNHAAATDQASRAAHCALALRAIVPGVPIALATGRGDATTRWPVGEVIDRAVHVLRLAEARSLRRSSVGAAPIEMDELTSGLLDARFEVRLDRGARQLLGVRDAPIAARTLLGKPTPFVGRTRELGMLEAIFDECLAEGIAQAVLIEGPPGVGKTRLGFEFSQRLASRDEPVEIWVGRGDPMSAGAPFGMVTQIVRRALGLQTGDPLAVLQARMRARLSRHVDGRTLDRWIEFLGELIDVPTPGEPSVQLRAARAEPILMGDQMRLTFEDWLAAECASRAILLVLEDLHWGDLPSVQFIDGALRQLEGKPLMVLAFARPEVHSTFPALWADRKVTRMNLGELTRKASERLVRHVLGDEMPDSTVTRLVDHAAGNAFYLEEVIRAAAATDMSGGDQELPPTVLAMVQARLEGLPAEARRVLRAASVFGQVFWRAGVKALLRDLTDAEVGTFLEELAQRELIGRRTGDGSSDGEWQFRHALVREAASAMLVDRDRAVGHRLAAEWLESNFATTHVPATVLAEHYERGGLPERAAGWFHIAAEEALEGNDFNAVIARAERGIACGQKLDSLGPLRLLQAVGYRWRGQLADAEKFAFDALNSLSSDDVRWYEAAGELAVASSLRGANERLVEVGELLSAVPLRTEMIGAQIVAWSRAATWLVLLGFAPLGDALCTRIDEAAAQLTGPDPSVTARVLYTRATHALVAGDTAEYLRLSEAAAEDFDQAGILRSLNVQRRNVGIAHVQLGNYAEAERRFHVLLTEADRMHIGPLRAEVEHWLGVALAGQGQHAEARRVEEQAVTHAVSHGARWIEGRARACLASMLLFEGLPEEAEAEARRAIEVSSNSPAVRALALGALAEVRLKRGFPSEALSLTRDALQLLMRVGGIEEGEALVRLLHAEALRATGAEEDSRRAIIEARDRLLQRVGRIGDEAMRKSMLERVPTHARTLELAAAWATIF
jgi:tetratricopeptide (TPR) repeat protein